MSNSCLRQSWRWKHLAMLFLHPWKRTRLTESTLNPDKVTVGLTFYTDPWVQKQSLLCFLCFLWQSVEKYLIWVLWLLSVLLWCCKALGVCLWFEMCILCSTVDGGGGLTGLPSLWQHRFITIMIVLTVAIHCFWVGRRDRCADLSARGSSG